MAELKNLSFGNESNSQKDTEGLWLEYVRLILPYSIILLLAILGNTLVIVTLVVNKRMRTVTNVFLFNLALSDILLGVFCMPFTLAGVILRAFVFGEIMCKMIPYLQAVSVSVGAWTLVAMSVERYYAICHPLHSRQWQTFSHAKRIIALVWISSLIAMSPIAVLSELQPVRVLDSRYKCRERWPSLFWEKTFNLFIDVFLLITPLVIMMMTYSLIISNLWKTMRRPEISALNGPSLHGGSNKDFDPHLKPNISSAHNQKSLSQKKRVIKMLLLVVLEFFVCWTPLYVINTVSLFDPYAVYTGLGYQGISLVQLLAYTSSCCNPITYCFMSAMFRRNFLSIFACRKREFESRASVGTASENRKMVA